MSSALRLSASMLQQYVLTKTAMLYVFVSLLTDSRCGAANRVRSSGKAATRAFDMIVLGSWSFHIHNQL